MTSDYNKTTFGKPKRVSRKINSHGLNVSHFRHELQKVIADLQYSTHKELARQLTKIANEADNETTMITAQTLENI